MTDESERVNGVTRRQIMASTALGTVGGLAGCMGGGGDGGGDGNGTDTETTTVPPGGTEGDKGGHLQYAQAKKPVELDPIVLNDVPSAEIATQMFEGLYEFGEKTKLVPSLAAGEPKVSNNGKTWEVPIDGDATFHNGDKVTAEDVKYSYRMPLLEQTENSGEVNMIDSVTVKDESTAVFELKYPYAPFKNTMTRAVVPKSVRENNIEKTEITTDDGKTRYRVESNDFKTDPVGSGPFTLDTWEQGKEAVVTEWGDYWGDKKPNLDKITFRPVSEPTTRITTLKNGKNNVVKSVPPNSWETVESLENTRIAEARGTNYFYLAFNCNAGPTTDPKVREAIDYAFSMEDAVSKFVEPTGTGMISPIPPITVEGWGFDTEPWKTWNDKDIDKAKSMLDSNPNVPDDWSPKIIVPPDNKRKQIGITVKNALGEAGYSGTVTQLSWSKFLSAYVTGKTSDYNMFTLGWAGAPDPDSFLYFLFSHEMIGVTNGCYFRNETMNSNIMEARRTTDRDKRKQLYQEAINVIADQKPHIPAYNLKNSFGVRSEVKSFVAHPAKTGGYSVLSNFNNTWVEK